VGSALVGDPGGGGGGGGGGAREGGGRWGGRDASGTNGGGGGGDGRGGWKGGNEGGQRSRWREDEREIAPGGGAPGGAPGRHPGFERGGRAGPGWNGGSGDPGGFANREGDRRWNVNGPSGREPEPVRHGSDGVKRGEVRAAPHPPITYSPSRLDQIRSRPSLTPFHCPAILTTQFPSVLRTVSFDTPHYPPLRAPVMSTKPKNGKKHVFGAKICHPVLTYPYPRFIATCSGRVKSDARADATTAAVTAATAAVAMCEAMAATAEEAGATMAAADGARTHAGALAPRTSTTGVPMTVLTMVAAGCRAPPLRTARCTTTLAGPHSRGVPFSAQHEPFCPWNHWQ
jgi:hypothetical protein